MLAHEQTCRHAFVCQTVSVIDRHINYFEEEWPPSRLRKVDNSVMAKRLDRGPPSLNQALGLQVQRRNEARVNGFQQAIQPAPQAGYKTAVHLSQHTQNRPWHTGGVRRANMNILLVEDEQKIVDFVCSGFREQGFTVEHSADGHDGYAKASSRDYDVIVLDIMLPGRDGLSILKALRKAGNSTPVLLLTARNELDDRLEGLNLGADDYLAKPFFVEELIARLHALQRRVCGERLNILAVGDLRLDRISREVFWQGQGVNLTGREFNLIEYLMRSPGRVFTRTQILEHVWGYDFDPSTNVVDVCIQRIRKKLGTVDPGGSPIESVRGVGYRFRKLD